MGWRAVKGCRESSAFKSSRKIEKNSGSTRGISMFNGSPGLVEPKAPTVGAL